MSYERRLEIEALPAEEGWGKWNAIVGHGTELVERKKLTPVTVWIATTSGPKAVEGYRYENWRFAERAKVVDKRWFSYTVWHTNTEYTDYSLKATSLYSLCAETREELCEKASTLLNSELQEQYKSIAIQEAAQEKFK
jgi:hypothetical protein